MDETHWVSLFDLQLFKEVNATQVSNTNKTIALLVTYLKNIYVKRKN